MYFLKVLQACASMCFLAAAGKNKNGYGCTSNG
jgi:hypothetical protein